MSKILITGGSGLIGRRLSELLLERGHHVSHLGRSHQQGDIKSFVWNVDQRLFPREALEGVDTVIHLAGAGIADKPWSDDRKREILESRTNSTRLLYDELKKGSNSVKSFISASAIGYYGFEDNEVIFSEEDVPGKDFMAYVTQRWEKEVDTIESLQIRVVKVRTGIVLTTEGGALKEIMRPVKFYVGAPLGNGEQYVSWIHLDDLCGIFIKALDDNTMRGPYNGVAPNPVTNRTLTKAIAKSLNKPLILPPVPAFVLKLLLGEMADLILQGNRVSAEKILSTGYTFKFLQVNEALDDLLKSE